MSELTFRDATPADAAVIAEIYNASIAAGGATLDQDPKSAGDIRRQLAAFGRRILLLEEGYHHLVARILAVNTASIEYNRKLGYRLVGTQKEIGWADGRWQDVVILQLVLDDVPAEIPAEVRDPPPTTWRNAR